MEGHLYITVEIDLRTLVRIQSILVSVESASIQPDFASILADSDRLRPGTKCVLHVYVVHPKVVFVDTKRATGVVRPC